MDGVTGFNPTIAKENIKMFAESTENVLKKLGEAYGNFFLNLKRFWASPKAVEFNQNIAEIASIMKEFAHTSQSIVNGATRAYNYAALANDAQQIEDTDVEIFDSELVSSFVISESNDFHLQEVNEWGGVGMNISAINDLILPTFNDTMKSVVNMIDALPTAIALYDTEDGQQRAYQTQVDKMKEKIIGMNKTIVDQINDALSTETDNITLAKQNAIDSLSTVA